MEIQNPGFWIALLAGLFCLFIFALWIWRGGRKSGRKGV